METITRREKIRFFRNWTLYNALGFLLAYALISIFGILAMETLDLPKDEWGTPFQQTVWKIVEGLIIGFCLGFIQWRQLRKILKISSLWMYILPAGIVLVELIVGIICWKMGLNRGEYSFWENYPLQHAMIAAFYGFVIGAGQLALLRKHFSNSITWLLASTLAWGTSILVIAIDVKNDIILLITFILGILLYGIISAATIMWVMKEKQGI